MLEFSREPGEEHLFNVLIVFTPFTALLYFLHTDTGTMDYIKASEREASEQTRASLVQRPQDDKRGRLFLLEGDY